MASEIFDWNYWHDCEYCALRGNNSNTIAIIKVYAIRIYVMILGRDIVYENKVLRFLE